MTHKSLPTCSLLIATYNWPEALEACLQSVFRQRILPNEILIADDGSDEKTRLLLEKVQANSPVPIFHIWHPDEGFRLAQIRNKAIQAARFDYIIQIDGDIILDGYFILDHLNMAKQGAFLCGSRVLMDPSLSKRLLEKNKRISKKELPLGYLLNSFRIPPLGRLMADRYKRKQWTKLRGCNMSFWKKDLLKVNGYNNNITGWGSEDAELAIRLIHAGIKKRFLKFMGVAFHIYHPEKSKANLEKNEKMLQDTLSQKSTWTTNGITYHE